MIILFKKKCNEMGEECGKNRKEEECIRGFGGKN
jgi:hypothetical protein